MWSLVEHQADACFLSLLYAILSLAEEQSIALLAMVNISHFFYNLVVHYKSMGWRLA
jgi:hypothetical protein